MGWRVGYIAYPDHDGSDYLGLHLVKVQGGYFLLFIGYSSSQEYQEDEDRPSLLARHMVARTS